MNHQITEHRDIRLPNGEVLEVDLTEELLERVRNHYNLPAFMHVSDSHVASFIVGAIKGAVDKAEAEDET